QAIPARDAVHEATPEPLVSALFEIVDRHALLLHPGKVPEIEDTLAIDMSQLEDVIVHDAFQMAAEDLAGIDLIESVPIPAGQKSLSFAGVEQSAIGRHCHDHIVSAEIKMLGDLYRGDDIREPGNADIVEGSHHVRVDPAASGQVAEPEIADEQQIERVAGEIGTFVIDFLDVAFGSRRADDVAGI